MSDFADGPFLTGLAVTAGAVLLLVFATWLLALRIGRFNIIDVTWGLGSSPSRSSRWRGPPGTATRPGGCSSRCSSRSGDSGSRPTSRSAAGARARTRGTKRCWTGSTGRRTRYALVSIYLAQAVGLWFISLPVQVAMFEERAVGVLTWVGTAVWLVGFFFESVGDWQLHTFKADPANHGQVMDRGLWRYTRHPNYFGDATMWWGLYLIAAQQLPGRAHHPLADPDDVPARRQDRASRCSSRAWPSAGPATATTSSAPAASSRSRRNGRELGPRELTASGFDHAVAVAGQDEALGDETIEDGRVSPHVVVDRAVAFGELGGAERLPATEVATAVVDRGRAAGRERDGLGATERQLDVGEAHAADRLRVGVDARHLELAARQRVEVLGRLGRGTELEPL